MSEKSSRYGKYTGKKGWGTPHHLHPKDWGDTVGFKGSDLNTYTYRDPVSGTVWHIHAPNFETAQAQAEIRGWVQYRKRSGERKSKAKSKRR